MEKAPRRPRIAGLVCLLAALGWSAWGCAKKETEGPRASPGDSPKSADLSGWIPFSSDEGGFSVMTPAMFNQNTESTPTDAGEIRFLRFTARPDFHHVYIIVVNRMPEALLAGRNPTELLQGTREGIIGQFQGRVSEERQMTQDGKAGLEIKLTGTSQGMSVSVVSRIILAGNGFTQLYVISDYGFEDENASRYFLDSFRLK
jgi:hypothetical protein